MQFYLDGKQLTFHELNTDMVRYKVFPSASIARVPFGFIIIQKIIIDGFTIFYTQIKADAPGQLHFQTDSSIILHVSLKNELPVYCDGIGNTLQREREFNLSYVNNLNCCLDVQSGWTITFDIYYSEEYLLRFVPYFPALEKFLENIHQKTMCSLAPSNLLATPEIYQVINSVLQHQYESKFDEVYAECKSLEILTLALHCIEENTEIKVWTLSPAEKNTFQSIHDWLCKNYDRPGTLKEIALRFGLNEYKLKKGFKQLYGSTVFEFLLVQKMHTARNLLRNSTESIEMIAYETGYSKLPHFSTAYKNFFGYSPIVERKRR